MKKLTQLCFLFILMFLFSCETENEFDPNASHPVQKEALSGYVQKGPFINGTSITISELSSELVQTGKTFSTQILDSKGSFEFRQLALSSQYVEIKADGFYYNEITGSSSSAQLTLYALSDLTDKSSLNVNILSHLEKSRIDYLVSQGATFSEAKETAQEDILRMFSISKPGNMPDSELLDISEDGDENAILLAISMVILGFRTDAELTELLADISTDIREDGILDDPELGTELINHAQGINLQEIRTNLVDRYDELGVNATIPDFEKYVQIFRDSTDYEFTSLIDYPETSNYGENILPFDKTRFRTYTKYSMAADLPLGTDLKIVMKGGLWHYEVLPEGPVNWTVARYNQTEKSQVFTSNESGMGCDLKIEFALSYAYDRDTVDLVNNPPTDTITIDYYENKSETPTMTKIVVIEEFLPWLQ